MKLFVKCILALLRYQQIGKDPKETTLKRIISFKYLLVTVNNTQR